VYEYIDAEQKEQKKNDAKNTSCARILSKPEKVKELAKAF
jgi:hypothetical protein